jgi:hypothetical protein
MATLNASSFTIQSLRCVQPIIPNERATAKERARACIGSGTQISMNLVRLTIPSPAFALLRGALAVAMQPEQATATAIISTNDLIRLSPEGKSIGANL